MASKSLTIAAALLLSASAVQAATVHDMGGGSGLSYYDALDRIFLLEGGAEDYGARVDGGTSEQANTPIRTALHGPIDSNEEDYVLGRGGRHLQELFREPADDDVVDSVGLPANRVVGGQNEPGTKLNNTGTAGGPTGGGTAPAGDVAEASGPGLVESFARSGRRNGFQQALNSACFNNCTPASGTRGFAPTPTPLFPPATPPLPLVGTQTPAPQIAPVPLPAGVFLLMGGLGALGLVRRVQKSRSAR